MIEDYGRFLKKKAKALLSEERVRVEPFTTSILDGIDIRETIRNWHQHKIFVRQADRLAGEVGAVVVIFDEDRDDRYQYLTTWLGEHQNESDMAFYSTFPFDNMVGPGIGRARVRRLADDPASAAAVRCLVRHRLRFRRIETRAAADGRARLFRGALRRLRGREARRARFSAPSRRTWAARFCTCPSAQLSPTKLKKLRVVHVLDSYERAARRKIISGRGGGAWRVARVPGQPESGPNGWLKWRAVSR